MGSCQRRKFLRDFDSAWRVFGEWFVTGGRSTLTSSLAREKRLESFADWSERSSIKSDDRSCCSSRRCEVELELSHSFTPATIKCALLTAFLKRSNREDLKISLVRVFSTQSSFQTGERCASRECIPTCGSTVKTWYADSPFSLRRSPMLTRHTTLERS